MESFCTTKKGKWYRSPVSTAILLCLFLAFSSHVWAQAPAPAGPQTPPADIPAAEETEPEEPKPNEVTFPNGVKMEVLVEGSGPKPPPNAVVHIQYIGHLEDGTEFARSYARRLPTIYALSDVIGCWQTGIPEMNVGSKAKFTCPPGSANAHRPVDFIWGNTTLYFVIELIGVVR